MTDTTPARDIRITDQASFDTSLHLGHELLDQLDALNTKRERVLSTVKDEVDAIDIERKAVEAAIKHLKIKQREHLTASLQTRINAHSAQRKALICQGTNETILTTLLPALSLSTSGAKITWVYDILDIDLLDYRYKETIPRKAEIHKVVTKHKADAEAILGIGAVRVYPISSPVYRRVRNDD
jgi:hypothetical protein